MIRFRGRSVDPTALWSNYVDFPANFTDDGTSEFAPLVQCPNPNHDTRKRHFQVNLKQATVHCFAGCGISGTYEHAISTIEGSTQREARRIILKHSRVATGAPRVRKRGATKPVSVVAVDYERFLPAAAIEYLFKRKISSSTIAKFELGWDPDDLRVVIPAKDDRGRVKFLIRRTIKLNVEPRYLYPEGSERNRLLFGACYLDLKLVRSWGIVLVEGSLDTMILQQYGIPAVGILGSKVSGFQAHKIANMRPSKVFTMFDADAAGVGATISARLAIPSTPISVCRYPKGKSDPAELLEQEAKRVIKRAIDFTTWRKKANVSAPKRYRRKDLQVG